jgi:hypothetical protein
MRLYALERESITSGTITLVARPDSRGELVLFRNADRRVDPISALVCAPNEDDSAESSVVVEYQMSQIIRFNLLIGRFLSLFMFATAAILSLIVLIEYLVEQHIDRETLSFAIGFWIVSSLVGFTIWKPITSRLQYSEAIPIFERYFHLSRTAAGDR